MTTTTPSYELSTDLTAELTERGYVLTVFSASLDDYDLYRLEDGEWELYHDSLSNRLQEANDIWDDSDFEAWTEELKKVAKSDSN